MRYQMGYLAGNSHLLPVTFLYLTSRRAMLFVADTERERRRDNNGAN